jgi:hypothetical protein
VVERRLAKLVLTAAVFGTAACSINLDSNPEPTPRDSRPAAELRVGCGESVHGELTAAGRRYTYTFGALSIFGVRSGTAGQASTGRISKPSFHKALVVVNPGSSVTIVIPDEQRGRASLFYDPRRSPTNNTSVSDGMSTVTFQACADRRTQFAGGFIVESGVSDFRVTISAGSQTRTVPLTF